VVYSSPVYVQRAFTPIRTVLTPVRSAFTRSATVPVVTTINGQVISAGYKTATVRAAFFPRLKAQRLANGYAVQAQAGSVQTVLVQ
jgi:hypothetical protein